jgi:hypothetical protein
MQPMQLTAHNAICRRIWRQASLLQRLRTKLLGGRHAEKLQPVQIEQLCQAPSVQVKKMDEQIQMQLIKVRGRLKWKVNIVKGNRVVGFIKPVNQI